jgi:hypothetical protein
MAEFPDRYVSKIYGETDGGGTQVLYLSHLPFEDLGLPRLSDRSVPDVQQTIQHGLYQGFIGPIALYGLLGAAVFRNRKKIEHSDEPAGKGGAS